MKKSISFIILTVFLFGCASGNNIVSPSLSEDETKTRAKAILNEKKTPEQPRPSEPDVRPQSDQNGRLPEDGRLEYRALVNLLISKGLITQKEFEQEIEKMRRSSQ